MSKEKNDFSPALTELLNAWSAASKAHMKNRQSVLMEAATVCDTLAKGSDSTKKTEAWLEAKAIFLKLACECEG